MMSVLEMANEVGARTLVDDPAAAVAMNSRRFRIAADVVNKATAELPEDQRGAIRWLHAHAVDQDISLAEVASRIGKDVTTVHRIFHGLYSAQKDKVTEAIASYRRIAEEREGIRRTGFVETTLTRKLFRFFDSALFYQKAAFVFGESQIGKTTAALEYARAHSDRTRYVRMPTGGSMTDFSRRLATLLRISPHLKEWEIKERICNSFDGQSLLVVDQCHEVFFSANSHRSLRTLLFIMEIHDLSRCGVVLLGTRVFENGMQHSVHRDMLRQLDRRKLAVLKLPDKPSAKNLEDFARKYGLEPAADEALALQSEVIRDHDLGVWCTILQAGSRVASKEGKKMSWAHVIKAHAAIRALEQGGAL